MKNIKFIEKLKLIYPNYNYDSVCYVDRYTKVELSCPYHGTFHKTPYMLLKGYGCKLCLNLKKSNKTIIIDKLISIYGDTFDYSEITYKNSYSKIKLTCKKHNISFQSTFSSLCRNRNGCKLCRREKLSYTTDEFIKICDDIHNNKYDYSKTEYVDSKTKVKIICPLHGEFHQMPSDHIRKYGCKLCGIESQKNKLEKFIKTSNEIHNHKYDYSEVIYKNNKTKVKIICHKHGNFYQRPDAHLKQGCPKCSNCNSSILENKWLDLINVPLEYRQKTLSINGMNYKVDAYDPSSNTIYEFYGDYWHGNPCKFNHDEFNRTTKTNFGHLFNKTMSRQSKLISNGFNVIYIWESEFIAHLNTLK